jgi:hypothetical integral membrane protein (TIGR02206 family)
MTNEALFNLPTNICQSSILVIPFRTFGTQHLITLAAIIALCTLVSWVAGRGSLSNRWWTGRLLGFGLLGYVACIYIQQGLTHSLNWEYSLPLELCNLVLIACVISLFRPSQFMAEIAYFWGLGGVVQATLTPDLAQGFPSWDFILFFWGHGATLLAIIFLISERNFEPRRNSIIRMMLALNIYGLAVGSINAIAGWNYGYLCRKPVMPSILDFMGPWPWYLLSLELVAFLMFLVLDLLWRLLVWFRQPGKAERP